MIMQPENQIIYLSYFLDSDTPLYGGEKGIKVMPERSIAKGDTANTKRITLHNHSGTHIDFPNHFFENGKRSHQYPADFWIFNSPYLLVVDAAENDLVLLSDEQLNNIPLETDFLILKTGFGKYRTEEKYWMNNPGLHPDLAEQLRARCKYLRVIGGDYVSITSYQNRETGRVAHRNFLGGDNPILLVEDMDLSQLTSSPARLVCSPLMAHDVDGVPVTIIALQKG